MQAQRRGSVYLAVVGVVSVVTVLTLTGIALRKELHERAEVGADMARAARTAQSGAELAVHVALTAPNSFKSRAQSSTNIMEDPAFNGGTLRLSVTDADTQLQSTSSTSRFSVVSEGVVDESRSRLGLTVRYQNDDLRRLVEELDAVAYWPLDETTGTTAIEVINGRNGTYSKSGSVGWSTHKHGNRSPRNYWVDEYTAVPHHSSFEIHSGTIVFWAKWDVLPTAAESGAISKESEAAGEYAHFSVYLDTSNRLTVMMQERSGDRDGGSTSATGVISAGTWHHIAVSWGSSLDLWVDGVRVASNGSVSIGLAASSDVHTNNQPWYFGVRKRRYFIYEPAFHTYGSVARVALFKDNLSEKQIQALMEATSVKDKLEVEPNSYARVVD